MILGWDFPKENVVTPVRIVLEESGAAEHGTPLAIALEDRD